MNNNVINVLGWYGVAAILSAYALVSFGVLQPDSWLYQLLNLTGAAGIALEAWQKRDYQPVVLNLLWLAVALVAIIRLWLV